MRSLYAKFELSSFKTEGGVWGDGQTDDIFSPICAGTWQRSTMVKFLNYWSSLLSHGKLIKHNTKRDNQNKWASAGHFKHRSLIWVQVFTGIECELWQSSKHSALLQNCASFIRKFLRSIFSRYIHKKLPSLAFLQERLVSFIFVFYAQKRAKNLPIFNIYMFKL